LKGHGGHKDKLVKWTHETMLVDAG